MSETRARFEELRRRAAERAAACPNYPDTPEGIAELDAIVAALQASQREAIRQLFNADGLDEGDNVLHSGRCSG